MNVFNMKAYSSILVKEFQPLEQRTHMCAK